MGKKKKPTTHDKISQRGGQATLKKHGSEHFRDLVNKRWAKHRKAKKLAAKSAV